jgi:hypothetical protein
MTAIEILAAKRRHVHVRVRFTSEAGRSRWRHMGPGNAALPDCDQSCDMRLCRDCRYLRVRSSVLEAVTSQSVRRAWHVNHAHSDLGRPVCGVRLSSRLVLRSLVRAGTSGPVRGSCRDTTNTYIVSFMNGHADSCRRDLHELRLVGLALGLTNQTGVGVTQDSLQLPANCREVICNELDFNMTVS